jgi:uncharacterized protein
MFWDASAVVPLLVHEPRSKEMRALAESDVGRALWWGTVIECNSALCRVEREGGLTPPRRRAASAMLAELADSSAEVQPVDAVRARAVRLLAVHPLRSADALQLAAAMAWCREQPAGRAFVCLDDRLRAAAAAEGFDVLPP